MASTRGRTPENLLKRVIENILAQNEGSNIHRALDKAGITNVRDLISLTLQDINDLTYDEPQELEPEGNADPSEGTQAQQQIGRAHV